MAKPKDLDILTRSLSGDWLSRIDFFKRFIWFNPRVRRAGTGFQYLDDFLHDCFTNVLRTGHSFDPEEDVGSWVESVAVWTALERQRLREDATQEVARFPRLSAGVEGEEPEGRARLTSYVPPRTGPQDSLVSRVSGLIGEAQFKLLSRLAIENGSWEEAAAALGHPLNTAGPTLVRAIDFLSRFFCAPPPLNADLQPVFEWMVREDAAATRGDPSKPSGRILSMQLDPVFYAVTPEMRKLGLAVPAEARTFTLFNAARASEPPAEPLRDHLAECHYCADLLRSLLLMQQALRSRPDAAFRLCPGGFTLMNTPEGILDAFDQHLAQCDSCSEERMRIHGEDPEGARAASSGVQSGRRGKTLAWAALVLILLGGIYGIASRYFQPPKPAPEVLSPIETAPPAVAADPRFSGLAETVPITDGRWLASVRPENRGTFSWLIDDIQHGRAAAASLAVSGIADKDPGLQMLYSELQYQLKGPSYGYQGLQKAEAMTPRDPFRCWVTLQAAVILGDMPTITREVEHLSSDPVYAGRARALFERVRTRSAK